MPADLPSAALRVAAHASYATGDMHAVVSDDLRTLLPVLEAVARSGDDAGRVERMARVLCQAAGHDPDADWALPKPHLPEPPPDAAWHAYEPQARAAIALADAERAAEAQGEFAKACADIDRRADEISASAAERRAEFRAAARVPIKRFKL